MGRACSSSRTGGRGSSVLLITRPRQCQTDFRKKLIRRDKSVYKRVPVKADDSLPWNPVQEIRTGEPKRENSVSFQLIVLSPCIWISSVFNGGGGPKTPTSSHSACCCYNRPRVGALSRVILGRFFREDLLCFCFRLWVSWRTLSVHVIFFIRYISKKISTKLAADLKERLSRL